MACELEQQVTPPLATVAGDIGVSALNGGFALTKITATDHYLYWTFTVTCIVCEVDPLVAIRVRV